MSHSANEGNSIKKMLDEKDNEIETLQAQIKERDEILGNTISQIDTLNIELNGKNIKIKQLAYEIVEKNERIKNLSKERERLETKYIELKNQGDPIMKFIQDGHQVLLKEQKNFRMEYINKNTETLRQIEMIKKEMRLMKGNSQVQLLIGGLVNWLHTEMEYTNDTDTLTRVMEKIKELGG